MRICPTCGSEHDDSAGFCVKDGTRLTGIDAVADETKVSPAEARIGNVLGSYRLMALLGEGGMGIVYLAEHTRLGREVALKMLRPEYADDPNVVKRFFGEARAVNQIKNENIVEITDFIEDEGSENYYIMEVLKGSSLADVQKEGIPTTERTLAICIQVCNALTAVHDSGIVHRDLKPDNVFLTERAGQQDFVKLLDFGIAKLMDAGDNRSLAQTSAGAVLGTPEYMSPEQVSGKPIDHRTDIYALGVILYEMVTGRKPLSANTFGEMVMKHLTVQPPKPRNLKNVPYPISEELEGLILMCLEKDPENRPQTMAEIALRLQDIAAGTTSEPLESAPTGGRKLGLVIAVAAGVAVIIVGVAWVLLHDGGATSATVVAPAVETPAAQKASPEKIQIRFESIPAGAEVFRQNEKKPLGTTPFALSLEPAPESTTFEFLLAGYETSAEEVRLEKTTSVVATLVKVKPPPTPPKKVSREKRPVKPKKKRVRRGERGTIDPFAD